MEPGDHDANFLALFKAQGEVSEWLNDWRDYLAKTASTSGEPRAIMKKANPAIIPRNHRIEAVIRSALETGSFDEFHRFNAALRTPYEDNSSASAYSVQPEDSEKVRHTFCGT